MKRLGICTLLPVAVSTSSSIAFDSGAVERLKSKPVCADCDLSELSLPGAYLPGAVLTRANLTGADLGETNLNGADLSEAKFADVNMHGSVRPT
jgi:uncharacterized protein YjbI with pentapeptide repeats